MTLSTQNTLRIVRRILFLKSYTIALFLYSTAACSQDIISEEFFYLKSPSAIDSYFAKHFEISIADTLIANKSFMYAENRVDEIHKCNQKNKEEFQKLITLINENNLGLNNLKTSKITIRNHVYVTSKISNEYANDKVSLEIRLSVNYYENSTWRGFSGIDYNYYENDEQSNPLPTLTSKMDTTGYGAYAEKIISIIEREDKQAFFAELVNPNDIDSYTPLSKRNKNNFKKHIKGIQERAEKKWRIIKAMNSYSLNNSTSYEYGYDAEPNDVFNSFQMVFQGKVNYHDSDNTPLLSIIVTNLGDYCKIFSFEK